MKVIKVKQSSEKGGMQFIAKSLAGTLLWMQLHQCFGLSSIPNCPHYFFIFQL